MFTKLIRNTVRETLDKRQDSPIEKLEEEITRLRKQKMDAELELEKVQSKKQMEDEKLKHLMKMKEEKNQIELERATLKIEMEYVKKEQELQNTYHDKTLEILDTHKADMEKKFSEVLKRLPDVNYSIRHKKED